MQSQKTEVNTNNSEGVNKEQVNQNKSDYEKTEIPITRESQENDLEDSDFEGQKVEDNDNKDGDSSKEEGEKTEADLMKEMEDKVTASNDKYLRLLAEFENFKRRNTQEIQNRFKFASQSLAEKIISALDNLERAIDQAKVDENEQLKEFIKGIELIQKQLYEAFEKENIIRICPKGELFDPTRHEAIGVVETEEVQPEHIAQVLQAGYILNDRVLRPAIVQVAKGKNK